jgi:16S rRNA processing protein RimM
LISDAAGARVVLGRVLGAHGVRGGLRIRYLGDGPGHLLEADSVFLTPKGDGRARSYEVERAGPGRPGEVRVFLRGVDSREAAEALRGATVEVPEAALEALPEGEFYWFELVGCSVETEAGDAVGTVRELWETGPQDLLVVKGLDGRDRLIPTTRELVPEIDLEARRVVVVDLPGLLEPAEPRRGEGAPSAIPR